MYSLVGANTSSFQSLGAQLFVLVGDQVDAERELVDIRTLSAEIKDTCGTLVLSCRTFEWP
jgi:acyl dehydratase